MQTVRRTSRQIRRMLCRPRQPVLERRMLSKLLSTEGGRPLECQSVIDVVVETLLMEENPVAHAAVTYLPEVNADLD